MKSLPEVCVTMILAAVSTPSQPYACGLAARPVLGRAHFRRMDYPKGKSVLPALRCTEYRLENDNQEEAEKRAADLAAQEENEDEL